MEDLTLSPEPRRAYDDVAAALREPGDFLSPLVPSVVSLEWRMAASMDSHPVPQQQQQLPPPAAAAAAAASAASPNNYGPAEVDHDHDNVVAVVTPTRGHHLLFRRLEELDGWEKDEASLLEAADLTQFLTSVVTGESYDSSPQAVQHLLSLGQSVPRRVCQHPFRKNDIVWVCRTCQADETCVLCHKCFSQSHHEGHDVAFYHAQAGGCCDCGDPDAWDPRGFCPFHGPDASPSPNLETSLSLNFVNRVRGVVPACVDWMVQSVAKNAEEAFQRANPTASAASATAAADRSAGLHRAPSQPPSNQAATEPATTPPVRALSLPLAPPPGSDTDNTVPPETFGTLPSDPFDFFSPQAASNRQAAASPLQSRGIAEALGRLGSKQQGLYVVLLADDVHSTTHLLEAVREFWGGSNFYTDTLLQKLLRALKQYGSLVVWGTHEMVAECGWTQVQLWKDGDAVACARIGSLALERAGRLTRRGLFCSIATGDELRIEQRAVHVLQWLSAVARSCDPLCQTVAECILPNRHLVPLLRADFKMSARVTKAWYSLLLTLLAVPAFKSHLAAAYCDTYRNVTAKYARGLGVLERTGYTLSVQFLNRVTYVVDLVQGRDLLGKLGKAIHETLQVASHSVPGQLNRRLNPSHPVLTHRRYSPCVSDLKCVLNVHGMPRVVACDAATFLFDWVASLALAQGMDPHVWRHWTLGHVENESRGWVGAFNASISLGSLFERLLGWSDDDGSPITDPSSPYATGLLSCVEMTQRVLQQVATWQQAEALAYGPTLATTEPHRRTPCCLPISTVAAKCGAPLAMCHLGISQSTPFSFHLPLHRFVASCLRELCLRTDDAAAGLEALRRILQERLETQALDDLFTGLLEFPTLVLSRASQVRAGLWRRSGPGLNDQVLNYSEPPFCRTMRDADLLLVQFAVLARPRRRVPDTDVGMTFFLHLMIHRLGIFDFCGLAKGPTWDVGRYLSESKLGWYPRELRAANEQNEEGFVVLPWTYSPAREASTCLVLLEEFLHLVIVFTSELPLPAPSDRANHTQQAQWKMYREVIHRLASGPKTHSELLEVQHVLSHWDNTLLSEEGKLINPDDATTAALGTCLKEIAVRKTSGRLEPDKWEMKREAWESYDPAFFHISPRNHQTGAENRPKPDERTADAFGWEPRPYCPKPRVAHSFFQRLRRDTTADATILAVVYRVLHIHCRSGEKALEKNLAEVIGRSAYDEKSETALARVCHILTLGAYAWLDATKDTNWREEGGGSVGSIFFDRTEAPTLIDWIHNALLAPPETLLHSDWYIGEEPGLLLLQRLAVSGGGAGGFVAQDCSVRAGAAWLCDFCVQNCTVAAAMLGKDKKESSPVSGETELERRKREAKEKAMARMKAQAERFKNMMDAETGSEDETDDPPPNVPLASPHLPPIRANSLGSTRSSVSSAASSSFSDASAIAGPLLPVDGLDAIPRRLLRARPRCIICNYEESDELRHDTDDGEGQRKRSRRKTDNALGFVGYAQPSTVLKGGGGPPPQDALSFREHTGCFVQICSHAVHLSCCESYLATVSHREDRVGKRDEFRCPLCQRLSNCLVPFIDVGVDWIESPTKCDEMETDDATNASPSLHNFLQYTPWWVRRHNDSIVWDGQSAFIDKVEGPIETSEELVPTRRPSRRRLKKKDLYAAWNAMMRTPRFVRQKLRPRGRDSNASAPRGPEPPLTSEPEESSGETLVWRRFMDQVSDISYRADSKRLGDDRLHNYFGEFRHYVVEKYAYNMANEFVAGSPVDWPSCMFQDPIPDSKRQELSREKLLSKLLLTIQCFTYSVSCEAFEARRCYRKAFPPSSHVASVNDSSGDSVLSRFGICGVVCDGKLVVLPRPSPDKEDGTQPFDGRLGKLRYFALAVMAASGAVALELVQLVLPFPTEKANDADDEPPLRSPIADPILFGHVLTHVVAAMCASCGRGRARSDALDVFWPTPTPSRGSFLFTDGNAPAKGAGTVEEDCAAFVKLGLLARILQALLAKLQVPAWGLNRPQTFVAALLRACKDAEGSRDTSEVDWMRACTKLVEAAFSNQMEVGDADESGGDRMPSAQALYDACAAASVAAADFLVDACVVMQVLVPGVLANYEDAGADCTESLPSGDTKSPFEKLRRFLKLESIEEMVQSPLAREVVANWLDVACGHAKCWRGTPHDPPKLEFLRRGLYCTQGYHCLDWPAAGGGDTHPEGKSALGVAEKRRSSLDDGSSKPQGEDDDDDDDDDDGVPPASPMQIDHFLSATGGNALTTTTTTTTTPSSSTTGTPTARTTTEVLHGGSGSSPALVTFSAKKTVPLLGGYAPGKGVGSGSASLFGGRPRVTVMPTSYTDLYAELGCLLPDCEQTAVCLVCGEVLNAGGKGECTKHSFKCGAGAGLFFLLQECSGLILHKSKAAYIHSPYVDSHGETPQFRGRPLNLDLVRYDHLRELWNGHLVRQTVVAERGSSRQVILPDFY